MYPVLPPHQIILKINEFNHKNNCCLLARLKFNVVLNLTNGRSNDHFGLRQEGDGYNTTVHSNNRTYDMCMTTIANVLAVDDHDDEMADDGLNWN